MGLLWLALGTLACQGPQTPEAQNSANTTTTPEPANTMNSYIGIFEIPATDFDRAVGFYQAILDLPIETMDMPGMQMGILPYENQAVTGVITKSEGYNPSADGVVIYLNAGDDLQPVLDRVEANGGSVLVPKTPHADENGFFALFLDSEGNRLGLNSPN